MNIGACIIGRGTWAEVIIVQKEVTESASGFQKHTHTHSPTERCIPRDGGVVRLPRVRFVAVTTAVPEGEVCCGDYCGF